MTQQMQATAIVRQRGQLTIPDFIREITAWIVPGSVVSISRNMAEEIVIKPYVHSKRGINWDKLWRDLERVSSYKSKYKGSLSEFIINDRQNH